MKNFYTNKDENFLKKSDLIIFYKSPVKRLVKDYVVIGGIDKYSKVDIHQNSKKLPLLLARLAYVFEIYDKHLKENTDFLDFVETILKEIRVKKELKNHNTTLEEIAGVLYLIDNAKSISVIVGEIEKEELENLMSFVKMFESKMGIFSKNNLIDLKFYGI